MSGPKAGSYEVDPAVLAARRRRSAALDRYAQLSQWRHSIAVKLAGRRKRHASPVDVELGDELRSVDSAPTETIENWNTRVAAALEHVDSAITGAEHAERAAELMRQLKALADPRVVAQLQGRAAAERRNRAMPKPATATPRASAAESPARPAESSPAELLDDVARVVARLRPGVTVTEHSEIEALAQQILTERPGPAKSLLVELQVRVQRFNASARSRADAAVRATGLRDELNGLTGPAVDWARQLLDSVVAGTATLLEADVERIQRVKVAADADAARAYVVRELAEAFRSAGCSVQQGFATQVLAGRSAFTTLATSPDHAVELQLHDQQVAVRVVRADGATDAGADATAEREFCRRFSAVSADVYDRGVQLHLTRHAAPGEVPVQRVDAARTALGTAAPATALKARRMNR